MDNKPISSISLFPIDSKYFFAMGDWGKNDRKLYYLHLDAKRGNFEVLDSVITKDSYYKVLLDQADPSRFAITSYCATAFVLGWVINDRIILENESFDINTREELKYPMLRGNTIYGPCAKYQAARNVGLMHEYDLVSKELQTCDVDLGTVDPFTVQWGVSLI
jgi:hypothetical protein